MPLRANYPLEALKGELAAVGIHFLHEFPDGQVRWGDAPLPNGKGEKFKGRSVMTAPYIYFKPGKPRFDIFTIRNILERLGRNPDQIKAFEGKLEPHIHDED
jgi:hypothetical protein